MTPASTAIVRERPSDADLFERSSICDHCGRWIGWGTHSATGYVMPIGLPARPDGGLLLFSDGWTVVPRGVRRGEHLSISQRRFERHECGRPSTPTRLGRRGYLDPTRELRRQAALRADPDRS
jgi:hypothetical protein